MPYVYLASCVASDQCRAMQLAIFASQKFDSDDIADVTWKSLMNASMSCVLILKDQYGKDCFQLVLVIEQLSCLGNILLCPLYTNKMVCGAVVVGTHIMAPRRRPHTESKSP